MAEIIHPDPNQFNVAGSRWQISRHASGQVVWEKPGSSLGLIMDNDGYLAAFEGMFPLMVVRWGPGPYRLSAVVGGAALGRLGNMVMFWEAPDLETANQAKKEITKGGLFEPSFVTRTTRKDTEKLKLRVHDGSLQGDMGTIKPVGPDVPVTQAAVVAAAKVRRDKQPISGLLGYGNTVGSDPEPMEEISVDPGYPPTFQPLSPTHIVTLPPAPTTLEKAVEQYTDTAVRNAFTGGMAVLASALRGTLIKRQTTWGDRLRKIAEEFGTLGSDLEIISPSHEPLRARFHVGGQVLVDQVDSKILYHLAAGNGAHQAYLNWFSAYQDLEVALLSYQERHGDGTDVAEKATGDSHITGLLYAMAYNALTLYLVETGQFDGGPVMSQEDIELRATTVHELCEFIALKDADYGQAIRRFGMKGLLVRLFDKYSRYTTLASRADRAGKFESLEDTAKDLLAYSLMAYAFWDEQLEREAPALGV